MLSLLRDGVLDALALILPVDCAACGAPDRAVCARCRPSLTPDPSARRLPDGTAVFSGLDYEGIPREVILAFKERGRTELSTVLAPALAAAVREAVASLHGEARFEPSIDSGGSVEGWAVGGGPREGWAVELVAVPGSRRARRRRGFDPVAALIARAGLDRARVFAPARPHPAQKTLSLEQRAVNLAGVFSLRVPVAGRRFLLVDDVVTTGATLLAAAEALRAGGAEVVGTAAVASTPRLFADARHPHRERSVTFP